MVNQQLRRYLIPAGAIFGAAATCAVFIAIWSGTELAKSESATSVLSAFCSVLVALSALWIGHGLRRKQEAEAGARAELALNVELSTRVLSQGEEQIVEAEIRVRNISNQKWSVPVAYLFVEKISLDSLRRVGTPEISPSPIVNLRGANVARFAGTMARLCPDEEEVFTKAYRIPKVTASRSPFLFVMVELVGAPESDAFDGEDREAFDDFLDGRLREGELDPNWTNLDEKEKDDRGLRNTYMVIETAEKELRESEPWLPKRLITLPPSERDGSFQVGRLDRANTRRFRGMLNEVMMWSRCRVVNIGLPSPLPQDDEAKPHRVVSFSA